MRDLQTRRPHRIATRREMDEHGLDGVLALGLLPPISGASPVVPPGGAGQAAIQTLTNTATGGTFRVQLAGTSTAALTCTTTTGPQLQSAIQAALGLYQGGGSGAAAPAITVTGNAGGPWTVTIPPSLVNPLNGNTPLTIDNTAATGGTVTAAVTQEGIASGDQLAGSGSPSSEAPHVVGQAGQAAYATGWSSPAGASVALTVPNAAAARTDWEPLQYYLDADGYVHLEGVAVWGAGAAGLMFTLPAGYRPFQTHDDNNVEVRPDGTVTYMGSTASAGAIAVGDISYRPVGI